MSDEEAKITFLRFRKKARWERFFANEFLAEKQARFELGLQIDQAINAGAKFKEISTFLGISNDRVRQLRENARRYRLRGSGLTPLEKYLSQPPLKTPDDGMAFW